ncbi:MAG: UvrD-helicase domain-containing protein, partial [Anaerolineae bacterium]|nr:UvrD-helicase domain-containing protein [Anaerolineae bacterium]
MEFTPQQAEAVYTHDCNLIVTAGAGSGKTRVLVERFIALLDAHPDWPLTSIVAITFTEKAAREMRDRVRAAIEQRLVTAPDEDRARWFEHYAALSAARIGTIHGLCAQLLRANPAEARLDPAFEVLDETEATLILHDAIERALGRLVRDGFPAAALLSAYDLSAVRGILRAYAQPGAAESVAEALACGPDALWDRWQTGWRVERAAAIRDLRADSNWRTALEWIARVDPPPGDKLSPICEAVQANAPALLSGDDDACWDAIEWLGGVIRINAGSQANWGGAEQLQACKDALKTIREPLQEAAKDLGAAPGDLDAQALDWLVRWGEAIALAAEEYARAKAERTALDFADLEYRAHALLRDDEVCARYHAEFHHVLVDEFQDTNPAQRDIVYRLSAVYQPGGAGRLFVVGDPKQSIYAFRGADVSVFDAVRRDLLDHNGRELPLAMSFRAHERLAGAFNDLFSAILTVGDGPAARCEIGLGTPMTAYRACDLDAAPHQAQPITVLAIPRLDKAAAPEFQLKEDLRRWEAWALSQKLRELVETGAKVWERGPEGGCYRPAGFGDMAVLFRAMTSAPLVEEVFKATGIPYVTIAGRGYFDRQEVWDLLNLLRALHNPADDLALAAALRSPLFGLSDEALLALRLPPDGSRARLPLWQMLRGDDPPDFPRDELSALDFARGALAELRDRAGRVSNAELLARALALTGYLAALSGLPDGARRRGNVEKLLRLARASGRTGLGAFNAYARDLTVREIREGEATVEAEDAVKLMSVHASKGLEFPIVALFDTTWSRQDASEVFTLDPDAGPACDPPHEAPKDDKTPKPFAVRWAKKLSARREQAENRRLLYVAATRASDYLILSGTPDQHGRYPKGCWLHQWLGALGVNPDELAPSGEPLRIKRAWGECVIDVPATPPRAADLLAPRPGGAPGWDHPALQAGEPVPGVVAERPPLLSPVVVEADAPARALSATQIAKLGHALFADPPVEGRRAFRHAVLHDAPDALRPLPGPQPDSRWQAIAVGQTVHRALRAWLMPDGR